MGTVYHKKKSLQNIYTGGLYICCRALYIGRRAAEWQRGKEVLAKRTLQ